MLLCFCYGSARLRQTSRNGDGGQVVPCLDHLKAPTSKLPPHPATLLDFTLQSRLGPPTLFHSTFCKLLPSTARLHASWTYLVQKWTSPTSNDACCCNLETTCTRTTRDTRLLCLNAQLLAIVDLIRTSIRTSVAEDWTYLSSSLRPTENVRSRSCAARLSHSPSILGLRHVQAGWPTGLAE